MTKLYTIEKSRYDGYKTLAIHSLVSASHEADLAVHICGSLAVVAATTSGEDTAGRQALRLLTPEEIATRACDIAQHMWTQFEQRGWLLALPHPDTLKDSPSDATQLGAQDAV